MDTHPNLERRLGDIQSSVEKLENWRLLVVDPALKEHGDKIETFERIEMQITGAVKFVKYLASTLTVIGIICEILRAFHRI